MARCVRLCILVVVCLFATSALFAQDYAGSCNDCATCQIRDFNGNWLTGSTCASWSGFVPDCSTWGCSTGCQGSSPRTAVCQNDGDGSYHYQLVYQVENRSDSPLKLVSAAITTAKGKRALRLKRVS